MAGHSKWANIKFRKGLQDAKRGKIFTKLIREISVSARMGGGDEASNARLRDAVSKALKSNGANMIAMRYEGYGPGGVAVLVDCLSDNKNRTVSEVRHAFTKSGGNLGTDGSVSYLFNEQGEILLAPTDREEQAMDLAIEAGAADVNVEDGQVEVITTADTYHALLATLQEAKFEVEHSHVTMRAQLMVPMSKETADSLEKLIDMLEDLDDVQVVYSNAEFPDPTTDE